MRQRSHGFLLSLNAESAVLFVPGDLALGGCRLSRGGNRVTRGRGPGGRGSVPTRNRRRPSGISPPARLRQDGVMPPRTEADGDIGHGRPAEPRETIARGRAGEGGHGSQKGHATVVAKRGRGVPNFEAEPTRVRASGREMAGRGPPPQPPEPDSLPDSSGQPASRYEKSPGGSQPPIGLCPLTLHSGSSSGSHGGGGGGGGGS